MGASCFICSSSMQQTHPSFQPKLIMLMMGFCRFNANLKFKTLIQSLTLFCILQSTISQFVLPDRYSIDCGSATNTTVGGRIFISDNLPSGYLTTPQNVLVDTSADSIPSSEYSQLYRTARIFSQTSSYNFKITQPGRIWIRLFFYPFPASNYNLKTAVFSVKTRDHSLLSDFSSVNGSVKEYSVIVSSGDFELTFTPTGNSFAFLNGLEVVSVPDTLIADDAASVMFRASFRGLLTQAFETVARVNMGGPVVTSRDDSLGRTWVPDSGFLKTPNAESNASNANVVRYPRGGATENTAPRSVYGTLALMASDGDLKSNSNLTWEFPVTRGFRYLIRLHFCDIVSKSPHKLYFNVYIQDSNVLSDFDLTTKAGGLGFAYSSDFVTEALSTNSIRVSIGPSSVNDAYLNAILNGLEIWKMNNSDGSLSVGRIVSGSGKGSKSNVGVIIGSVVGVIVALLLIIVLFCVHKRRKQERLDRSKSWSQLSINRKRNSASSDFCHRYTFAAIQEATKDFDESGVIEVGVLCKVYRGVLSDGTKVAVKRGDPNWQERLSEFQTEFEMLLQCSHRHVISLIGFCDENNEFILTYEYMENGTLKSHLYGSSYPSMSWEQRVQICIDAARALHYLHTGNLKAIIHRDVRSDNILLDENLMAKVAGFRHSKTRPRIDQTHLSTSFIGRIGYRDPESIFGNLTVNTDVYSFGVLLLEVLCAHPPETVMLTEWAMKHHKAGQLDQIIDVTLKEKIRPKSLKKFAETAEKCLSKSVVDRPSMGDVLWNLEKVLQLQETVLPNEPGENSTNVTGESSTPIHESNTGGDGDTSTGVGQFEISSGDDISGASMSKVFRQLVESAGK